MCVRMHDELTMRRFFECIGERAAKGSRREIGGVSISACFFLWKLIIIALFFNVVSSGRKTATNKQVFVLNFKKAFIQYFGR